MRPSEKKLNGEVFALLAAVLGSIFPVIAIASFRTLPPLFTAAMTTAISAVFFGSIVTARREWRTQVSKTCIRDILISAIGIGVVYYALFFIGLKYTSPGNAALVSLMEVFFTFVFLNILTRHEPLVPRHAMGAAFMLLGAAAVLFPSSSGWYRGDVIILIATIIPPLANAAQQRARTCVSASYLLFWRSLISSPPLLILSLWLEKTQTVTLTNDLLVLIVCNGIFIFGLSKILWVEAIHRIPITKTISLACIQPLLTMIFAYFFLRQSATVVQLLSLVPMAVGMLLLTRRSKVEILVD